VKSIDGSGGQITPRNLSGGSNMVFWPQIFWKEIFSGTQVSCKIIKIVATSCRLLRLKCTKSALDPAGRAYSAPSHPLAGFKGFSLKCGSNFDPQTKKQFQHACEGPVLFERYKASKGVSSAERKDLGGAAACSTWAMAHPKFGCAGHSALGRTRTNNWPVCSLILVVVS